MKPDQPTVSAVELFDELVAHAVGAGLLTFVLFPFALPVLVLVAMPLIALALAVVAMTLVGVLLATPVRLMLSAGPRGRKHAAEPARAPGAGPAVTQPGPAPEGRPV